MTQTTTTVTTTVRRKTLVPKRKPRLVKRVRKVVIRTVTFKGAKATARAKAEQAEPMKRAEIVSIRTTRALPAPIVSELTVRERQRARARR